MAKQELIFKGSAYQYESGMQLLDYVIPASQLPDIFSDASASLVEKFWIALVDKVNVWIEEPYHLHVYADNSKADGQYRLKVFKGAEITADPELTDKEMHERIKALNPVKTRAVKAKKTPKK